MKKPTLFTAVWAIAVMALIALFCISIAYSRDVVEIPLRVIRPAMKRVFTDREILWVCFSPTGELFAIREDDVAPYLKKAKEAALDPLNSGVIPPTAAGSTVAWATVTIEESDRIALWMDHLSAWVVWLEDYPPPPDLLNGAPVTFASNPGLPNGPALEGIK